ncbi:hypothetical protein E1258_29370 [Micromonospora sp. KC207]|nr:hypothetical protein E1258_29370 [Micromonospora sp. KC207]
MPPGIGRVTICWNWANASAAGPSRLPCNPRPSAWVAAIPSARCAPNRSSSMLSAWSSDGSPLGNSSPTV